MIRCLCLAVVLGLCALCANVFAQTYARQLGRSSLIVAYKKKKILRIESTNQRVERLRLHVGAGGSFSSVSLTKTKALWKPLFADVVANVGDRHDYYPYCAAGRACRSALGQIHPFLESIYQVVTTLKAKSSSTRLSLRKFEYCTSSHCSLVIFVCGVHLAGVHAGCRAILWRPGTSVSVFPSKGQLLLEASVFAKKHTSHRRKLMLALLQNRAPGVGFVRSIGKEGVAWATDKAATTWWLSKNSTCTLPMSLVRPKIPYSIRRHMSTKSKRLWHYAFHLSVVSRETWFRGLRMLVSPRLLSMPGLATCTVPGGGRK